MPGSIQSAQSTLNNLYALYNSLVAQLSNPQSDVLSYQVGDRTVTVRGMADLEILRQQIAIWESVVTADVDVRPNMGGPANVPQPGGGQYLWEWYI